MKVYLDEEVKYEFIRKYYNPLTTALTEFLNIWGEQGWELVKLSEGDSCFGVFVKRYVNRKK